MNNVFEQQRNSYLRSIVEKSKRKKINKIRIYTSLNNKYTDNNTLGHDYYLSLKSCPN